jgi:hypothetical protein
LLPAGPRLVEGWEDDVRRGWIKAVQAEGRRRIGSRKAGS